MCIFSTYTHTHTGTHKLCTPWVYACVHTWWQLAWTLQRWWHCDDLSQRSTLRCHWLKYHMEWHMVLDTELTRLPACLPARGKAVGQSHFQQINLIWKFSSPCNLKRQQQGSASPPILDSFLSPSLFLFSPSVPHLEGTIEWGRVGGWGGTEGWMSARKEGGRERGMEGGRLVIISKGHSVNDYPLG